MNIDQITHTGRCELVSGRPREAAPRRMADSSLQLLAVNQPDEPNVTRWPPRSNCVPVERMFGPVSGTMCDDAVDCRSMANVATARGVRCSGSCACGNLRCSGSVRTDSSATAPAARVAAGFLARINTTSIAELLMVWPLELPRLAPVPLAERVDVYGCCATNLGSADPNRRTPSTWPFRSSDAGQRPG